MAIISLSQKTKRLEIQSFEIDNPIIFNYFNKLSSDERDEKLLKAIQIGVLALMEDRISSFLSKTSNELGTELESLKMIFDMKQEVFYKSTVKGLMAEDEIAEFMNQFFTDQKLKDEAILTGNAAGKLPKNKTGDIVCIVNGDEGNKIVIESKFDKSIKLGDIQSKDIFTRKSDTAWSQLIEALVNREAKASIIVFDISMIDNTILNSIQNVRYIPSIGMAAIIDTQKGDYNNLAIAYMLTRDIVMNAKSVELDKDLLSILVNRLIRDVNETLTIKNLVLSNIDTNKKILAQLEKSLLLMEFNQTYLSKFLSDGKLSKHDLLDFYSGEELKDKYKLVEKEIYDI